MTTPDGSHEPVQEPAAAEEPTAAAVATPAGQAERRLRRKVAVVLFLVALLTLFSVIAGAYLLTRKPITELPLPGIGNEKLPHYAFSIYGTSRPMGVAVSPSGDRIYVTETDGDRVVRIYDRSGKSVGTIKPPATTGAMHVPVYIALDPASGDVYVSDRPSQAVYVYDRDGRYRRTFQPKADVGGGWRPLGLAFDPSGSLYVTDVSGPAHRVLVLARDGTLVRTLGAPGQLSFPNGVAIDPRGNTYVSDSNNGRVVIFDPTGKLIGSIRRGVGQGDLGLPRGTAIDDSDRLYVVDTASQRVQLYRLDPAKSKLPVYLGAFGVEGRSEGAFEYPNGVAVDTRARIYVTDRENNRVQVWSY